MGPILVLGQTTAAVTTVGSILGEALALYLVYGVLTAVIGARAFRALEGE